MKNLVLERLKTKISDTFNIGVEIDGSLRYLPDLQDLTSGDVIIAYKKRPGTAKKPAVYKAFTEAVDDEDSARDELKRQFLEMCTKKSDQKKAPEKPETRLQTKMNEVNPSPMEEDFMIATLCSQYKVKDPIYLIATGGSGIGKSRTIDCLNHPDLSWNPTRMTENSYLGGFVEKTEDTIPGFVEALGKCAAIDEAAVLLSERPDVATKIYSQLLGSYGRSTIQIKAGTVATIEFGDKDARPCSMILCMTNKVYYENYKKWISAGYRFVTVNYPVDRHNIYINGCGVVKDGSYEPGIQSVDERRNILVSHLLNTRDKYKELVDLPGEMYEYLASIASKTVILARIYDMESISDGDSANRLATILTHIVQLRSMLHGRPPGETDLDYAERFVHMLISNRYDIKKFGEKGLVVSEGIASWDGEKFTTGIYSETTFYEHAKMLSADNRLWQIIDEEGKMCDDWRNFIYRTCHDARKPVRRNRVPKEQKPKNFIEYPADEEPIEKLDEKSVT